MTCVLKEKDDAVSQLLDADQNKREGKMNTSGSYAKLVEKASTGTEAIKADRPKLEDLLNELIEAEKPSEKTSMLLAGKEAALSFHENDWFLTTLPGEIVSELGLEGKDCFVIFEKLKKFHHSNRHNPVLSSSDRIVYIDYDLEMDRIRLFVGPRSKFRTFQKGLNQGNATLNFEYAIELSHSLEKRSLFAQERKGQNIAVKLRQAREFLSAKDSNDKQTILHFVYCADKGTAVSSCCLKTETVS